MNRITKCEYNLLCEQLWLSRFHHANHSHRCCCSFFLLLSFVIALLLMLLMLTEFLYCLQSLPSPPCPYWMILLSVVLDFKLFSFFFAFVPFKNSLQKCDETSISIEMFGQLVPLILESKLRALLNL